MEFLSTRERVSDNLHLLAINGYDRIDISRDGKVPTVSTMVSITRP